MRASLCLLLIFGLVCVEGRGGVRVRFGGGGSGVRARPRGTPGWFTSSGRKIYIRTGGAISYARLRNDIDKEKRRTNFGTKSGYTKRPTSTKMFGIGVGAGFLGGSGFSHSASLASYTIYHRYLYLMTLLHSNGYNSAWDTDYHQQYYERNKCLDGCPPGSHCEWGTCECDEGLERVFGQCSKKGDTEPVQGGQALAHSCSKTEDCWKIDMNLVCEGKGGRKSCTCRKDMAWNQKLLECQIFLDVSCQKYDRKVPTKLVQEAAKKWREAEAIQIEKEQEEKCRTAKSKCLDLCDEDSKESKKVKMYHGYLTSHLRELGEEIDKKEKDWKKELGSCADESCKKDVGNKWDQYQQEANCSRQRIEIVTEGVSKYPRECGTYSFSFVKRLYTEDNKLKCSGLKEDKIVMKVYNWINWSKKCTNEWCESSVNRNCKEYCEGHQLEYNGPEKRTETKNESLANSLMIYIKDSRPKEKDLVELFCRDVDSFNLAFKVPDEVYKPSEDCKPVPSNFCAVVYDSHDCYAGWSLNITDGDQLSFGFFSSQRNDIDTVGVRAGCIFTGFSGSSFSGTKINIAAGLTEKWVVLAAKKKYKHMHQNIESLQCVCRHSFQNLVSSVSSIPKNILKNHQD